MLRVVLAGGPGAGKTTVLAELASRGYFTAPDSARSIIAERRRTGQSPRPPPLEFANEIFRRDVVAYDSQVLQASCTFYERGVVDALGMLSQAGSMPVSRLQACLRTYAYHRQVFIFPPWREIYANDTERDQTFAEAQGLYPRIESWYRACGYEPVEVPFGPVKERAEHVLRTLRRATPEVA